MLFNFIDWTVMLIVGRDSAVGTAPRYGLDGPGIKSLWGWELTAPIQTGPRSEPGYKASLWGERGRVVVLINHPIPSAEVEE